LRERGIDQLVVTLAEVKPDPLKTVSSSGPKAPIRPT
jgi:hypothetical protein